jgi:hypothetical protein
MGYRAGWLAVKNADLTKVLRTIGLTKESESDEAIYEPGHYAVAMSGGWLVVIGSGSDQMNTVEPEHARLLSKGTEALHFMCSDTVMVAAITAFRDGKEVWSLVHDGSNGSAMPDVAGNAPPMVAEVIAQCLAEQKASGEKNVDYLYEAAPEIGRLLTGFRHDQTLGDREHLPIFVLAPR